MPARSFAGRQPAPEIPPLEWLNVERPLSLAQLRGKVVLLDFWTYGCINCIHIIPDLKQLEAEFPEELVVIGVHSAKFRHEGVAENLRSIIARYELEHPVVNDRDFLVWRLYNARAWPTVVLIDPAGNYVGSHSGEGVYPVFAPAIRALVEEFDARGLIDRRSLPMKLEEEPADTVLSFPGQILADVAGGLLLVADSNHNRIVLLDMKSGEVRGVVGGPDPGFADGDAEGARFFHPQGMALSAGGDTLFVADTENHALRAVELASGSVRTIAGTGRQSQVYPGYAGRATEVELNSPWDLELVGENLFVAMAGNHQLWRLDLASGEIGPWVGSGAEGIGDGPAERATLAQPSGLATDRQWLYFADPEASAIRAAVLASGRVKTLVGTGLFDFGDQDGVGDEARLQHPLGIAYDDEKGLLYVADTYNSKLKVLDPASREVRTIAGVEPGFEDGREPRFNEPGGLGLAGDYLFVADTNNHAVRRLHLPSGETDTLPLTDPGGLLERRGPTPAEAVRLPAARVRPGEGLLRLALDLPAGFALDPVSPLSLTLAGDSVLRLKSGLRRRRLVHPDLPLELLALFEEGEGTVKLDLDLPYCPAETGTGGLCRAERVRLEVPLRVEEGGEPALELRYRVGREE